MFLTIKNEAMGVLRCKTLPDIRHYTIIDFNEVDMRIYLPEKEINHRGP